MRTSPSSMATVRPSGIALTSSPLGPLTRTWRASVRTSTPLGITTGILPMRDTVVLSSPDVAEHFATETRLARHPVGNDSLRRGHDGHAQPAQHRRNRVRPRIDAAPGPRDSLETRDDGLALAVVLQPHAEHRTACLLDPAEGGDVALLLEHLENGLLHGGGRHVHAVVARAHSIAQARQQVGQRITRFHLFTLSTRKPS